MRSPGTALDSLDSRCIFRLEGLVCTGTVENLRSPTVIRVSDFQLPLQGNSKRYGLLQSIESKVANLDLTARYGDQPWFDSHEEFLKP